MRLTPQGHPFVRTPHPSSWLSRAHWHRNTNLMQQQHCRHVQQHNQSIKYPPGHYNRHIRRLHLHLTDRAWDWRFLPRFSAGELGFPNLQHGEVGICGFHGYMDKARDAPTQKKAPDEMRDMPTVVTYTKVLVVRYRRRDSFSRDGLVDPMESIVFEKLSIQRRSNSTITET
ncbi:hypothetical protein BU26DRAFT_519486 [Trematosphaeria pertusa]|uniref:Uncharacterized protein n=1 Tax=Trematosphaeria pertusa TaxID=390896 RepID=A0A6A6IHN0_9PLEO|nr:uncharacterized protein BU26DRAFT_519486 [Trematosphaeria pertusa]KAF2249402.1 hypothetical protein BU26DRAFT_519486 [Trematosphaeria pertusa]